MRVNLSQAAADRNFCLGKVLRQVAIFPEVLLEWEFTSLAGAAVSLPPTWLEVNELGTTGTLRAYRSSYLQNNKELLSRI